MDLILRSIFFNQEKMRLLFLLLSVLFFTLGNAQNLKITYNVKDFDTQIPDTYASNPSYNYLIKKNNLISLRGQKNLHGFKLKIPGDPSSAAP